MNNNHQRDLKQQWQSLLQSEPKLRIRNAAEKLGVSEADLLATQIGEQVTLLAGDFKKLLTEIESLGVVMALTRNDAMVHEKTGQYKDLSIHGNMGLALGVIDLRLFFSRFVHGFYVQEPLEQGARRSIQFFNAQGEAVHKIYAKEGTDLSELDELVQRYRAEQQQAPQISPASVAEDLLTLPGDLNTAEFRQGWDELKDVHHFQALLKKHSLARIPAYQTIGSDYAIPLNPLAFEKALEKAVDKQQSIMVFVGSDGVVQIHTGVIHKLLRTGSWFNILDPGFNLHANTEMIDQLWLVRKPTSDGIITSVEAFDADGKQLVLLFGERENGKPEMHSWRELLQELIAEYSLEPEHVNA
ncbi:hemin-degrading factor [Bacterioplanoides sp. SCSIO 12839]|uniref:hemin-degrading factor n=1 Tax=Bacterioplanoides sp. SCSIO 12839 TaxID=2829569 RepID=UPI0021035584|nr:ChuX/HutX family heme-like substrate-binding protein [Bacterioplanoides sp. SCSIO 12839]UTW47875.1 hemin-degrading factor [Bacterioplanoides sp. SCSIO 12839]